MNRILKIGLMYLVSIVLLEFVPYVLPNNVNLFAGQYIVILLPAILIGLSFRVDLKERFKLNKFKPITILYLLVIFFAMLPVSAFISELTTLIFGENPHGIAAFTESLTVTPFQELFIIAITPAICEEIMFRGLLLDTKSGLNIHGLAILGGLMFGLFHVGYDQVFYTFALGMVFTYAAVITGSIFPAMILHFFNNGFSTALGILLRAEAFADSSEPVADTSLLPWMIAGFIGIVIITFMYKKLAKLYNYNDKTRLEENIEDVRALQSKSSLITYAPVVFMIAYVIIVNLLLR